MTDRGRKPKNFICPGCLTKVPINSWPCDEPPKCNYCKIPLVRMENNSEVENEH